MRRKRIAALMAGIEKEYQRDYASGLAEAAQARGVDLCIFNCKGFSEFGMVRSPGEFAIFDLPDLNDFDGITALCATIPHEETLRHINEMLDSMPDKPLVVVDVDKPHAVMLNYDGSDSECALMAHLLEEHGYRRFAVVTGPLAHRVARDRAQISISMVRNYGGDLPEEAIIEGRWTRESGYEAADKLLKQERPLPEVIVCGNDDMAFGVIQRLEEAGVKVPEQVKVTGYDAKAEAVARGLVTVRRPSRRAGNVAVNVLCDWIEGSKPKGQYQNLPTELIHGDSCGCPQCGLDRSRRYLRDVWSERLQIERGLIRMTSFSNALVGVSSEEEIGQVISEYAQKWGVEEMHICVDPWFLHHNGEARSSGYPDRMLLLSSYSKGRILPQCSFETKKLLPMLEEERDRAAALVFCPLYYLDHILGYAVFDMKMGSALTMLSVMSMLDGALMNLSLQSTIRSYAETLEHMSVHDPLTGLYNRRGYQQIGRELFAEAGRNGRSFAVVSVDMDGMKQINDRLGHLAGDQAICRMGNAMRVLEHFGLTCVHISGDEFVAVGPQPQDTNEGTLYFSLNEGIDEINREHDDEMRISASIGVYAAVPQHGDLLEDFVKQADRKMYENKQLHHAQSE